MGTIGEGAEPELMAWVPDGQGLLQLGRLGEEDWTWGFLEPSLEVRCRQQRTGVLLSEGSRAKLKTRTF